MTESDMQRKIVKSRTMETRCEVIIPNCYTRNDNEADLFCIRKSGFVDEIEIKVSKSDFRIDEKKTVRVLNENSTGWSDKWIDTPKREALIAGKMTNYYWYAIPFGLVDHDEIPEWAGILEVYENGFVKETRRPKKLHKNKMSLEDRYKQVKKLHYRIWK